MRLPRPGSYHLRAVGPALGVAAAAILCLSCGRMLDQADLEEFVDTGLTNVLLRSASFSPGAGELGLIPSDNTVTCSLSMINPKAFDVSYTLGWSLPNAAFAALPPAAPSSASPTSLSFPFALDPALAEHQKITFTLGMYVPSINKTFEPETFTITCDSPPDPPARVTALVNPADNKSVLAILLPTGIIDDDIAKLKITWGTGGSSDTGTYTKESLAAPPSSNPFSGAYSCYFQPASIVASYGYDYSVVLIDQAGQSSSAATCVSADKYFPLNYDGNGSTSGSPPASVTKRQDERVAVADPLVAPYSLARTDYAFSSWNTKADGSGASYDPGAAFTFPACETTLYAQWYTTGVRLSFDLSPQGLVFSPNSVSVRAGDSIPVDCPNPTLRAIAAGWAWYIDGSLTALSGPEPAISGIAIGSHIVSCTVEYNGILYSGYFRLVVTE